MKHPGTFITALRRAYPTKAITAYIRSSTHDDEFHRLNINVVRGTVEETEKLVDEVSRHDMVVDMANSDDPQIAEAVLRGFRANGDRKGTWIHLSGAGVFADGGVTGNSSENGKYWSVSIVTSTPQPRP